MKDETETGNVSVLSDLVVTKLKDIGVRTAKLKKIKCFLQKQDESNGMPTSDHMFGVFLSQQQLEKNESGCPIPRFLKLATNFLSAHLTAENVFRKNGLLRRQKELKKALEEGGTLDGATVDDVASLLKLWFRQLPEPIIPFTYHDLFFKCQEICKERNDHTAVLLACLLLPINHLNALKHVLQFLAAVASQSNINHMDSWNLGVVMAPNFLPPEKDVVDKNEKASNKIVQHQTELIQMLINHADEVGTLPSCHLDVPIPSEEDEISDPTFRRKKRKSMHEVVDCLRKRVIQTPSTREPYQENTKKPLTRSGSKRKGEPLSQPSPCKKWASSAISVPAVEANSSTPLRNRLNNLSIHDTAPLSYASPSPRKGFGLLRRRSRFRKSKCFTTPYKRNTRKAYNNQARVLDNSVPKSKPDLLLKNKLNNFERKPSPTLPKIINANSEQQSPDLQVKKDKTSPHDSQIYGDHKYAIPTICLTINHDELSLDAEALTKSPEGPEVSVNSTDSDINVPVQFLDTESSARKMCLRRGRPNTLKMGLKSPFVPRSCSESVDLSNILTSPNVENNYKVSSDLSNISTSPVLGSTDKMSEVSQLSESPESIQNSSSSGSDSSLRRFLTENILNALSFSSFEFSLGSNNDGKSNENEIVTLNPTTVGCNPEVEEQQGGEGVKTSEFSLNSTNDGKSNENELATPNAIDRNSVTEEALVGEINYAPEVCVNSTDNGRPNQREVATPSSGREEHQRENEISQESSAHDTPDPFITDAPIKEPSNIGGESYLNSWSQCNLNCQNPFSNSTCTSDIGTLPSFDSICKTETPRRADIGSLPNLSLCHAETPGSDLDSPHQKEDICQVISPVLNSGEARTFELATPTSPPFDAKDGNFHADKKVSGLASSTPVQKSSTWMNEEQFKALLDNVPESEGSKRESILKIRMLNAGRVKANVQHYDKIAGPKGSPYPNVGDGMFVRNGLVTRSVRDTGRSEKRNLDSQGFAVPKGFPSSIKRSTRSMRSTATTSQDSPLRRCGSNVRFTRSADKIRPNKDRNLPPLRSKLYFGDECKENDHLRNEVQKS